MVFKIVENHLIVFIIHAGESHQVLVVCMQDNCRRIAVACDDCGVVGNVLRSA